MKKKIIILGLIAMIPMLVFSQASGGQIKRPPKVNASKQSHRSNGNTKQIPIVDIRPRTISVYKSVLVGHIPWTLLSVDILDNCTKFHWSVSASYTHSVNFGDIFMRDNATKTKYSAKKAEGTSVHYNQIEVKKNSPTSFTLIYSALPKGVSTIDIEKESVSILSQLDVSTKDEL